MTEAKGPTSGSQPRTALALAMDGLLLFGSSSGDGSSSIVDDVSSERERNIKFRESYMTPTT